MKVTRVTSLWCAPAFKPRLILFIAAAAVLVTTSSMALSQNTSSSGASITTRTSSGEALKGEVTAIPPQVGQAAPDFHLPYATMEKIYLKPEEYLSLSGMRGKNVILAFYPADWSGGCTKEVCTLRDTFSELARLNAAVLGISGDYVFSHHEWAKFHKLQFPLLSDHDHKVARLYGSFNEAFGFNNRTVFLIDKDGVVRYSNLEFKAGDAKDYNRLREELMKLK
jgi:peroxiredoxin Q/BCP